MRKKPERIKNEKRFFRGDLLALCQQPLSPPHTHTHKSQKYRARRKEGNTHTHTHTHNKKKKEENEETHMRVSRQKAGCGKEQKKNED